jgi:general secretion pathway protein D
MTMSMHKSWSATAVILAALLICSISSAAWSPQQPGQTNTQQQEERRRMFDRLTRQIQDQSQQGAKQPPGQQPQPTGMAPAQIPGSASAPGFAPATMPSISSIQAGSAKIQLTYDNADLYDFINQIASTLKLTPIVIDPEVKGIVTIQSTAPMSADEVLPLFNMILKNNNAALIKQGNIYQIVPASSALKKGVDINEHAPSDTGAKPEEGSAKPGNEPTSSTAKPGASTVQAQAAAKSASSNPRSQTPGADDSRVPRMATYVIRVDFVPVKDLIEPIKLFTESGIIMPYERENMLILTDYSDNAARMMQIIRMLDNSYLDPDLVELVKVKNNSSSDVADDLKKVFGSGAKDSTTGAQFISLDRLNAIFVMASSKRALSEVKRWVDILDSTTGKNIQTFSYVVQNSTASNIAMMVSALYGEGESSAGTSGGTSGGIGGAAGAGAGGSAGGVGGARGNAAGANARNAGGGFGNTNSAFGGGMSGQGNNSAFQGGLNQSGMGGNYFGGSSFGSGQSLGVSLNQRPTITSQVLRGGAFAGLQDVIRMVVDDVNNTLIFKATPADYANILETIKQMDVLPRQAIIDARIFEIDLTDDLSFGISGALQGTTTGQHLTTMGIGTFDSNGAQTSSAITGSITSFVGNSREILLNLEALRTKTKVRILEAPSVLALDGTEAKIVVGSEVAYPGSTYYQSVGGTSTSVQYRDTGISLLVLPRISASGSVTLDLAGEISSPGVANTYGPSFGKTQVQTTLSVKDGEMVAIAGLIRDNNSVGRAGIPLLSEIPILGSLFGHTQKTANRTELIILITPHVISTPESFQEKSQELKDSLRNVRKLVDEKQEERIKDMEDAREDRYKQEQKRMKSSEPEHRGK